MGAVYRATDSRLGREVAIKVLPEAFTADPDRLARFEREARVLASLNHPHIATLHGLEEADGRRALVMELVEGPALAERLRAGPLPAPEALTIAIQIAEALEAAHEKGVVHRDLKPANVKLTAQGQVKVLDFGLAKALAPDSADSRSPATSPTLMNSPTLTAAATQLGTILGTAAYMSPEQARGRAVDKRADIWAFGALLFEMLAGRRLFRGDSVPDALADVLRAEIDLAALPASTPAAVRRLLRRCLERDLRHRLHDVADARIVLEEVLAGRSEEGGRLEPERWRRRLPWGVAALAAAVAAFAALRSGSGEAPEVLRSDLAPPRDHRFYSQGDYGAPAILSPDGDTLVFGLVGTNQRTVRLWSRSLATGEARPIEGTDGAASPFFAPGGEAVAFFADGKLKTVALAGGRPLTLADAPNGRGGAWAPDGTLVFAPDYRSPLYRVRAAGGETQPLTTLEAGAHSSHRWPALLPGGRALVYLAVHHSRAAGAGLRWVRLDGSGNRALLPTLANGAYAGGRLLFLRESTLFAQRLDPERGALLGDPAPILQGVLYDDSTWRATYAASERRLVAALGAESGLTRLSWRDRSGRTSGEVGKEGFHGDLRLSPDGALLAESRGDGRVRDLWLVDLGRGVESRFTFEPASEYSPVWSPDGQRVYYLSTGHPDQRDRIFVKPVGGAGGSTLVYESTPEVDLITCAVTPDGRALLVLVGEAPFGLKSDLALLPLAAGATPRVFLETPFAEIDASLSPDGRFLAYASNESGVQQIFVLAFAGGLPGAAPAARWQVSLAGGRHPVWSAGADEILYLDLNTNLMSVPVARAGAGALRFGTPQILFASTAVPDAHSLAVAADGRILLNQFGEEQSEPLRLIEHWTRLLPP